MSVKGDGGRETWEGGKNAYEAGPGDLKVSVLFTNNRPRSDPVFNLTETKPANENEGLWEYCMFHKQTLIRARVDVNDSRRNACLLC